MKNKLKTHRFPVEKRKVNKAIEGIFSGFVWKDTKQGVRYWERVIENLEGLKND